MGCYDTIQEFHFEDNEDVKKTPLHVSVAYFSFWVVSCLITIFFPIFVVIMERHYIEPVRISGTLWYLWGFVPHLETLLLAFGFVAFFADWLLPNVSIILTESKETRYHNVRIAGIGIVLVLSILVLFVTIYLYFTMAIPLYNISLWYE